MRAVLVGLGMVAQMHADAIRGTQGAVTLAGVLARRPERAQDFAAQQGGPKVYATLEEVAADPDVDLVIVATPPDARQDLARILAEAGKPTLMEKPLERDLPRALKIVETFETAGTPLGAVLQHRMRPAARDLHARLSDLGQIGTVEVRVPWWRPQTYYDTPGRGTYARDGGGVLITQAIHTLDLMLHLAGPVASVQAMTHSSPLHKMEAEDFAACALRFASGAVGSVMASTTHFPGDAEEIVLNGTKGSARLTANSLSLAPHDGPAEHIGAVAATGGGADPMAFSSEWHRDVIADFAKAIAEARAPTIPARAALGVHGLIDAITKSAATGTTMTLETP